MVKPMRTTPRALEMSDAEFDRFIKQIERLEALGCDKVARARKQLLLSRLHEIAVQEFGTRN